MITGISQKKKGGKTPHTHTHTGRNNSTCIFFPWCETTNQLGKNWREYVLKSACREWNTTRSKNTFSRGFIDCNSFPSCYRAKCGKQDHWEQERSETSSGISLDRVFVNYSFVTDILNFIFQLVKRKSKNKKLINQSRYYYYIGAWFDWDISWYFSFEIVGKSSESQIAQPALSL